MDTPLQQPWHGRHCAARQCRQGTSTATRTCRRWHAATLRGRGIGGAACITLHAAAARALDTPNREDRRRRRNSGRLPRVERGSTKRVLAEGGGVATRLARPAHAAAAITWLGVQTARRGGGAAFCVDPFACCSRGHTTEIAGGEAGGRSPCPWESTEGFCTRASPCFCFVFGRCTRDCTAKEQSSVRFCARSLFL